VRIPGGAQDAQAEDLQLGVADAVGLEHRSGAVGLEAVDLDDDPVVVPDGVGLDAPDARQVERGVEGGGEGKVGLAAEVDQELFEVVARAVGLGAVLVQRPVEGRDPWPTRVAVEQGSELVEVEDPQVLGLLEAAASW